MDAIVQLWWHISICRRTNSKLFRKLQLPTENEWKLARFMRTITMLSLKLLHLLSIIRLKRKTKRRLIFRYTENRVQCFDVSFFFVLISNLSQLWQSNCQRRRRLDRRKYPIWWTHIWKWYLPFQNNMNYAICIKRQWDTCSVTYTNEIDSAEFDFQMINVDASKIFHWTWTFHFSKRIDFSSFAGGTSVIPEKMAGVEIFNCNDDFISVNSIRLCGEKLNDASRIDDLTLNAPITDLASGPIVLPVRSNDAIVGRGFRINYKSNPCQPTVMPTNEIVEEIIAEEQPVSRTRIRIRKKYLWRNITTIFLKTYIYIYLYWIAEYKCIMVFHKIRIVFFFILCHLNPELRERKCTWATVWLIHHSFWFGQPCRAQLSVSLWQ